MLFRRSSKPPQPQVPDPVVDAQIHWLGSRGLVKADSVSRQEWIATTEDPTDPFSLASARTSKPCVTPEPAVTIKRGTLTECVEELADGLKLPIDEVREDGRLLVRSGTSHFSFDLGEHRNDLLVLEEVARTFVDSAHVLHRVGQTFAIVHRDIADIAMEVMAAEAELKGDREGDAL